MRFTKFALLFVAVVFASACSNQKPIQDGFACVMPIPMKELQRIGVDMSCYQETATGSGQYVPKGWAVVANGPYKGCYVPYNNHDSRTTIPPPPHP